MSESFEASVVLPVHLHARPAGQVVLTAARFPHTQVEISYGERTANARGVLGVMGLGATAGTTVIVRATGDEAPEAVNAVVAVLTATE